MVPISDERQLLATTLYRTDPLDVCDARFSM
jgi:hypothetical protein